MMNKLFLKCALFLLTGGLLLSACAPQTPFVPNTPSMKTTPPLVIAHRGARSLAPENTLAAARKAFEVGSDLWELDVAVTADGELVLMHDDSLARTCNAPDVFPGRDPYNVWDFTLAEIQTLDCGSWFNNKDPFDQIAAGNVTAEERESYVGEKVPTLRQALEFTRDNNWRVNVEIKDQPDSAKGQVLIEKTVALVTELGMDKDQQVVISSFNHDYLRRVRALNPNIPIQAITQKLIGDLGSYLKEMGSDTVNPKINTWSYENIMKLEAQGIHFNVWTVNEELEMKALINVGASGIITDFPQTVIELLNNQ